MALDKKQILKGKNKFLVKLKDPSLGEIFLEKLQAILEGWPIEICEGLEAFSERMNSQSLFDDVKRIIVLSDLSKDDLKYIRDIIQNRSEDSWVFFERQTLPRNKAYIALKGFCEYIEMKNPSSSQMAVRVRKFLSGAGLEFEEELPSYIASRSNRGLGHLLADAKKLTMIASAKGTKQIDRRMCDAVIIGNQEAKFFDFMEDYFKRRFPAVIEALKRIDEYSFVKLLHFLIGQAQRLYDVAVYSKNSMSDVEIAEMIGVSPYIVKTKYRTLLAFYGKIRLMKLLDVLNEADTQIRWSKYPNRSIFEYYLMRGMRV